MINGIGQLTPEKQSHSAFIRAVGEWRALGAKQGCYSGGPVGGGPLGLAMP
jgi:hypothetical protein